MTPEQLRAARAALRVSVKELSELANVAMNTVSRYENGGGGLHADTRDSLQTTLEKEGIVFTPSNGVDAGVALRKDPPANIRQHVPVKRSRKGGDA